MDIYDEGMKKNGRGVQGSKLISQIIRYRSLLIILLLAVAYISWLYLIIFTTILRFRYTIEYVTKNCVSYGILHDLHLAFLSSRGRVFLPPTPPHYIKLNPVHSAIA